jgi:hypothetical protein
MRVKKELKRKLLLEDLRVLEVLEEGRVLSEEEKLRKATIINELERTTLFGEGEFYDSLFTIRFSWRPKLDGLTFDSIGEDKVI